jgi:hypothetical protein
MSEKKLRRGRCSPTSGRRIFGDQTNHPAEGIQWGKEEDRWQSWAEWLKEFQTEKNFLKQRAMLETGAKHAVIIFSEDDMFKAFAFYLAMADRQDLVQRHDLGKESRGKHRFHWQALYALFDEVMKKDEFYQHNCENDPRYISALVDFFCEWKQGYLVSNANLWEGTGREEQRLYLEKVREWVKGWASRVWCKQQRLLKDKGLRRHLLTLMMDLRCIGIRENEWQGIHHISTADIAWLRKLLREDYDVLLTRGPLSSMDSYAAQIIALASAWHRARRAHRKTKSYLAT